MCVRESDRKKSYFTFVLKNVYVSFIDPSTMLMIECGDRIVWKTNDEVYLFVGMY